MIKVYFYDWKDGVSEFFDNLKEDFSSRVCYFYTYDTRGDSFCFVVSDKALTVGQVEIEVKKTYS